MALILAFAALACGEGAPAPDSPRAPELVLVVLDTLRPDRLGLHGYPLDTSPFLDAWAEGAAVFDNAYSTSSWTAPSVASILSGLYPTTHGLAMGVMLQVRARGSQGELGTETLDLEQLSPSVGLLGEHLQREGYFTLGAAANLNVGPYLGLDRGFDSFLLDADATAEELATVVVDEAQWARAQGKPVFYYVHANDVHVPYEAHDQWFERNPALEVTASTAYDSEISYLDSQLRTLFETMAWGDDTLVVIVSDHGEQFGEHGGTGHHWGLYGELNRVLFMVRGPGVEPQRIAARVSLVDIAPTLLARVAPERELSFEGLDLWPLLGAQPGADSALAARVLFAHRANRGLEVWPTFAAMLDSWKYIVGPDGGELFDLEHDPLDQRDLAPQNPQVVASMQRILAELRESSEQIARPVRRVEIDRETADLLEALGYAE